MPVKYDIGNVYESAVPCRYCNGSGYQHIAALGYRTCQYCVTGYKVRSCENCHGQGCTSCMGTIHNFFSEIAPDAPAVLPDTPSRRFAGEAAVAPPRTILRR